MPTATCPMPVTTSRSEAVLSTQQIVAVQLGFSDLCEICFRADKQDQVGWYKIMTVKPVACCRTCFLTWYETSITDPVELAKASIKSRTESLLYLVTNKKLANF